MVTKVVSLCLFGGPEEKDYGSENWFTQWLPSWLRAQFNVFPDFDVWLYHDSALYQSWYGPALAELDRRDLITLIYVRDNERRNTAMVWRHKAIFESGADIVTCRDIDTIPTPRDRRAVQEFIDSEYIVHGINDSPQHNQAMMHGMVSFKPEAFMAATGLRSLEQMLAGGPEAYDWSGGGAAQNWFGESVWPRIKDRALFHSLSGSPVDHEAAETRYEITGTLPHGCMDGGDFLLPHLGAPTYQEATALAWYKANGDPEIEAVMKHAETFTGAVRKDRPRRRAIIGCDTNLDYAFALPLTCLTWSANTDLTPTVLLVGTPEAWHADPKLQWVVKNCLRAGADVYWLGDFDAKSSTVAQLCRLYAFELFPEAEYLLTSDADMWVFDGTFFRKATGNFDLYSADAYTHEGLLRQPICYLGASPQTWHSLMGDSLREALSNVDTDREWFADEDLIGERLRSWRGSTRNCGRGTFWRGGLGGPVTRRVDREQFFDPEHIPDAIDAHVRRNGWTDISWGQYDLIMSQRMPDLWKEWRGLRTEAPTS